MRLIDADALKKEVENLVVGGADGLKNYYENGSKSDENAWIGGIYDAWELIDNAPTVNYPFYQEAYQTGYEEGQIERLIRCKDCKHTVLSENGKTLICCLTMRVGTVRPNFYCGNGEMKGGAE